MLKSCCLRPEALWLNDSLDAHIFVVARLNTISVFLNRGRRVFELNAVTTIDDSTSGELPCLSYEEFRRSTGEHVCPTPSWSSSWRVGFSRHLRQREHKVDQQQGSTTSSVAALFADFMPFLAPTRRRSLLGIETACTSPPAFRIRRDIGAVLLRPIAHSPFLPVTAPRQRPLYLSLGRLPPRTSRNSFGPFRSRRLRRCRSSSGADGSIKRSISWAAISDAFAAFLVRTPVRGAMGACSVTRIDLHSSQTMSAASWSFFSFAFVTSRTIGRTDSHVSHHARGKH